MDPLQSLPGAGFHIPVGAIPPTPKSEIEQLPSDVLNLVLSRLPMDDLAKIPSLNKQLKRMTNNLGLWKHIAERYKVSVPAGADADQIKKLVKDIVEPTRVKGKHYFLEDAFGHPVFHIPKGTDPRSIPTLISEDVLRAVPGPAVMYFPLDEQGIGSYGYKDKDGQVTYDVLDPSLPPRYVPVDAKNIQIMDDLPSIPEAPFMQQTSTYIVEGSLAFPWLCPTAELNASETKEMARSVLKSFPGLAFVRIEEESEDIVLYKDTDGQVKELAPEEFAKKLPALSKTHTEMYYLIG